MGRRLGTRWTARGTERRLATVLFTDMVGSTELAARLGDRRWQALLAHYHRAVRQALRGNGGREVDNARDGFFAVFKQPAQAISCACELTDALHDAGIEVRTGIHMGEVEPIGAKLGGIAVHIGARVAGAAEPGDVLVSSTVHDVVSGADFDFDDAGHHALRGVPGDWRLYRVMRPGAHPLGDSSRQAWEGRADRGRARNRAIRPRMRRAGDALDFVGREAELAVLRSSVDAAVAGRGALVLVTGEPGIGKTRLAEQAASYGESAGMDVRRARGWEGGGAPAYWLWLQVIEALPTTPVAASEADSEQARFQLFDSVTTMLRDEAAARPMLIVLDDLQWSDIGSAMLLRHVARRLRGTPMLVLGVFRDLEVDATSELGKVFADIEPNGRMVALGGLSQIHIRALLASKIGPHEAGRLASDVERRSGGNPLFVTELSRLLAAREGGMGADRVIPGSVRAVIERRLSKLPVEDIRVLRVAATAGEEFRLDIVERASDCSRYEALQCIDRALHQRLIREAAGSPMAFGFTHALVREVLCAQLTLTERAGAHLKIAEALEQAWPSDPPCAELAHHFVSAAPIGVDERAVDYAERAGRQALEQFAYEDAAAQFTAALGALDLLAADDDRRVQLLLNVGDARLRAGEVAEARAAFEQAAGLARRSGRSDLLAEAALGFGAGLDGFEVRLFDRAQIDLLEEALAALPAGDSALRAWTMARLSVALIFSDSEERRRDLAERAVAMAKRVGDPRALAYALGAHCDAVAGPADSERRLEQSTEMVRLARESGARGMELLGRRLRLVALLELGDVPGVDAEIEAYARTAEVLNQRLYQWYVPLWRGMRALMDGRLNECRELAEHVSRIGERARSHNAAINSAVLRYTRLRAEGKLSEGIEHIRRSVELSDGIWGEPLWVALYAPTELPDEARAAVDRLSSRDFSELPRDTVWLACMGWVADACVAVGHGAAAEKLYAALLPYGHRFAIDGIGAECAGSVSRRLGSLAALLGRFGVAAEHFETALEAHRRAGASLLVADTLSDYGSMLSACGEAGRGTALLNEALSTYRELGMDVRAAQLETLLTAAAAGSTPAPNVFRREGEYWTLAYGGRTARVRDAKGLHDIAALIARQGKEVHVADLIAATEGRTAPTDIAAAYVDGAVDGSSSAPMLDEVARAAYRKRLVELRDELAEAERFNDVVHVEKARAEMDILAGELASAFGLGGRPRSMATPAERARKAVAQRVHNALRRIESANPELARHLDRSLRMGSFCSYAPERPTVWAS